MFAREPSQMPGIPREVIEHHLKINPNAKSVSQKPRRQSVERQDFIRKEVRKLLNAGFIEEVHHPVWLANPVIVPKATGKLRNSIDYTSLNKACPKDPYPLPRIDQIVNSTSGCDLLSFLDAYSGFHQIQMSKEDRKHTTFVTVDGLYCYVMMPYGLKNALPTFVRAMSKTFGDLIRDKVEVYVDDIVVKTKRGSTLVEDLTLVFDRLRATRTKLNPDKCVFGVSARKLLGFLVLYWGIEAKSEKIKAIEAMRRWCSASSASHSRRIAASVSWRAWWARDSTRGRGTGTASSSAPDQSRCPKITSVSSGVGDGLEFDAPPVWRNCPNYSNLSA
jgi:hypothetical protein